MSINHTVAPPIRNTCTALASSSSAAAACSRTRKNEASGSAASTSRCRAASTSASTFRTSGSGIIGLAHVGDNHTGTIGVGGRTVIPRRKAGVEGDDAGGRIDVADVVLVVQVRDKPALPLHDTRAPPGSERAGLMGHRQLGARDHVGPGGIEDP